MMQGSPYVEREESAVPTFRSELIPLYTNQTQVFTVSIIVATITRMTNGTVGLARPFAIAYKGDDIDNRDNNSNDNDKSHKEIDLEHRILGCQKG